VRAICVAPNLSAFHFTKLSQQAFFGGDYFKKHLDHGIEHVVESFKEAQHELK